MGGSTLPTWKIQETTSCQGLLRGAPRSYLRPRTGDFSVCGSNEGLTWGADWEMRSRNAD